MRVGPEPTAYLVHVIPEYVGGRFRAEVNDARQVDGAALVHVQIGTTQDDGVGHCASKGRGRKNRYRV